MVDLQTSCVYGPVKSRRLGESLGINPLPAEKKVCSFDCIYCQYGFEEPVAGRGSVSSDIFPSASTVLDQLESRLKGYQGRIDSVTFSGNGEPTLHPGCYDMVKGAVKMRDHYLPGSQGALLSNGTTVGDREVQDAIRLIDDPIVKMDAGDEDLWFTINRPNREMDLDEIVSVMGGIDHIIIQSMFFEGDGDRVNGNISEESLDCWFSVMEKIRPRHVQIYTLDRTPAMSDLRPAPQAILEKIQSSLERLGVQGCVY